MARTSGTVEDVLRLGAQGRRYELIDGELVPVSPTGLEHGEIETHAAWVFYSYVLPRRLGKIFSGEALFRLDPATGLARAPDIAFDRRERLVGQNLTGAFSGAPDLAVEIVSPNDSAKDVERKVEDWLSHGTFAVAVMFPETRGVVLWRPGRAIRLRSDDELDLGDVIPGFRCTVRELFPPSLDEPTESRGE
jgi:Uma2 family endonuclease